MKTECQHTRTCIVVSSVQGFRDAYILCQECRSVLEKRALRYMREKEDS